MHGETLLKFLPFFADTFHRGDPETRLQNIWKVILKEELELVDTPIPLPLFPFLFLGGGDLAEFEAPFSMVHQKAKLGETDEFYSPTRYLLKSLRQSL